MVPSCAEGCVLGVLCATIGATQATEAIKLITGIGDSLLGRLMVSVSVSSECPRMAATVLTDSP